MKTSRLALFILCCLTFAAVARAQNRPPRNYEDRGACPFECCTYRDWSVKADTVLYGSRSTKSRALFRVKKGERVEGLTGVVITLEPGRAVATGDVTVGGDGGREVRVKAGDVLYLLNYTGEGFYKIWFRGRFYHDQPEAAAEHARRPQGVAARAYIRKASEPQTVWWVKVRNRRGRVGWSRQPEHFGDMDACGG
jgi:hypothetical protein